MLAPKRRFTRALPYDNGAAGLLLLGEIAGVVAQRRAALFFESTGLKAERFHNLPEWKYARSLLVANRNAGKLI